MVSVSGSTGWNPLEPITMIIGSPTGGVQAPTMMAPSQTYSGSLNIQVNHRDSLNLSESRTEGKEVTTTIYKRLSDGEYVTLGSGDNTMVLVNDNDRKLFFSVQPLEGSGLYISPSMMTNYEVNPRVIDYDYLDVTQDGLGEWVFTFDITDLSGHYPQTYPVISLFSMTYDEGKMMLTSPSDIKVGIGSSINNIKWELEVPENKAVAINRVELILDSGDSSLINDRVSWIKIPYFDNLEFPEMDQTVMQGKIIYKFKIGTSLAQAGYVSTEHGSDPRHDMTVRLGTSLEKDEEIGVTLKVTAITPDQSYYTVSDKVILIASSEVIPTSKQILDLAGKLLDDELDKVSWYVTMDCNQVDGGTDCTTVTKMNNYTTTRGN